MMSVLDLDYNFASLSLRDLLEARDTYHYHLLSKANVVGTAVGLYLIRKGDPWPKKTGEGRSRRRPNKGPRNLDNSEVRDYSWPCVLAFVRSWAKEEEFGPSGKYEPAQIVPKTLYMADGRAVPVCVVEAPPVTALPERVLPGPRPAHTLGGGCAILVDIQGETHQATAGCLVTDGHTIYAITARHACGEPGETIYSVLRGGSERIGISSKKQLTRADFSDVYPEFPNRRSSVALDIGLVRVQRIADWTSNTYGLPPLGPMADLHEHNLSLRLIDQPVIGFGAVSGLVGGRIKALFYRYRSVGGVDYVGDYLIAPEGRSQVQPGDSGMIWHLDLTPNIRERPNLPVSQRDLRPLAVEWGGEVLASGSKRSTFAIATSLSTTCRLLDVELVTDVGRDVSGYWGRTGHYSIAAIAIGLVKTPKLKALLQKNAALLSFELSKIEESGFDKAVGKLSGADKFVPLADVPDEIWKKLPKDRGGRTGGRDTSGGPKQSNGPEHPNHYADIDAQWPGKNHTLRELCLADPNQYLNTSQWLAYYQALSADAKAAGRDDEAKQYSNKLKQGLLPFRVWQFFKAMTGFLQASPPDIVGFVTAAGALAHYVGDASQPLHGSVLADGDRSRTSPRSAEAKPLIYGEGVHSAFETAMLSRFASSLLPKAASIAGGLSNFTAPPSGFDAAKLIIQLMDTAASTLKPAVILNAFEASGGTTHVDDLTKLYKSVGGKTATLLALGAHALAKVWEGAWAAGSGDQLSSALLVAFNSDDVRGRYIDTGFIPSVTLGEIAKKKLI
jgi:hypothetical protein